MKLSVIIPSYKDPLLQKTIDSLLNHSELGDLVEIIPVLDGYWPAIPLHDDPRVNIVHLGKNRGMRGAINAGISVARGEYLMRTDEHCEFGQGYDRIMLQGMSDNWIMTARRYFLDPTTWTVMDLPYVDYEKLVIQDNKKFSGQRWDSRSKERSEIMVDETMAMQGSMWLMKHSWWDSIIKELQTEGYGPHYQDSHEMIFKTWQAGGKMMLNKNTWFAHKHRSFPRTHNGTADNPLKSEEGWQYSLDTWRDYYEKVVRPLWKI